MQLVFLFLTSPVMSRFADTVDWLQSYWKLATGGVDNELVGYHKRGEINSSWSSRAPRLSVGQVGIRLVHEIRHVPQMHTRTIGR